MKLDTLPLKDVFQDLASMSNQLHQLLNNGKGFDVIIKYLIEKNFDDEETPFPLMKDAAKEIGIPYSRFRTLILKLYEEIRLNEKFLFEVTSVNYVFSLNLKGRHLSLTFKDLKVVPRVGERIYFPFFRAYIQNASFHVKNVHHHFYNDTHEVDIELGQFDYNLYWKIRLDEARLKEELTLFEQLSMSEDELKEKLGFMPHWKRNLRR